VQMALDSVIAGLRPIRWKAWRCSDVRGVMLRPYMRHTGLSRIR